ncbi:MULTISPECIES: D-alanyl-D-alanine carboxypeptidase family protein [unclassified Bartonella]|uniref:D-alanyl-D-alanine carboxypeptidase family protein n=1 Tax=unclassified Bartonella TaxID=2645622 RepID=UPI000998F22F|nr:MULTISPECIES: D-alanyl-D-alanine carboxypeptidase family protein [unclassified Bartonella]AQX28566.1 D-alanyl-D-alanine carboxypeptidase [Bartonella sp. JB15]AQX29826.1 D-alanyl-D-alanine carboxypeptidase [Bartonella sp. JB63]
MNQFFHKLFLSFTLSITSSLTLAHPFISVDATTGRILKHNQAFERWYPASLTKLMTAYVIFRAMSTGKISPYKHITISKNAAQAPAINSGYKAGSILTLDTALKITLVKSTNDLAIAISEAISGSQEAFVQQMNAEAQRLGMFGTNFTNTSGLPDPNNYSTARDIALLAVQIRREFPQYAHYFSIAAIDFGNGQKIQLNSNNLIGRFDGIDGMKTGFICASGFNLVASATRNKRTIIAVILGSDSVNKREEKAAQLLDAGFSDKGSPQSTLATLEPYGTKISQTTDMRQQICTPEALKMRLDSYDEEGNIILTSPLITPLPSSILPLQVKLINAPKALKINGKIIREIPIPHKRPPYHSMIKAVNHI